MNEQEHKCQCSFAIKMLGDGCRYCQPQEYIDRLHDTMDGMIHTDCFELTDEEILKTCIKFGFYDRISDPYMKDDGNYSLNGDLIEFARAILRKAQEK